MLYPIQTKSRIVSSLDGMWEFVLGDSELKERWNLISNFE